MHIESAELGFTVLQSIFFRCGLDHIPKMPGEIITVAEAYLVSNITNWQISLA